MAEAFRRGIILTRRLDYGDALHQYIHYVSLRESETLRRLREETANMPLAEMQIPPEEGQFLALLVQLVGARRTLEIGVFTGYSTLWIASALPPDGLVLACDISVEWTSIARRYWCEAGLSDRIELRLGPAENTLADLLRGSAENFDFVFIDADKPNYGHYYDCALQLLRPGGVLAIDNTLRSGEVIDSAATDPGTVAIKVLNERMRNDKRIAFSLLPIGDGLTVAMKRRASLPAL
jgi:caffeoyl-CoA O-methyltransferase